MRHNSHAPLHLAEKNLVMGTHTAESERLINTQMQIDSDIILKGILRHGLPRHSMHGGALAWSLWVSSKSSLPKDGTSTLVMNPLW
jgi:hypothetical protein